VTTIASLVSLIQDDQTRSTRVDVFNGSAALGQSLTGGAIGGLQEIPMATWTLHGGCVEPEAGGGLRVLVPGIYAINTGVRIPSTSPTGWVIMGVSFGLPVYIVADSRVHSIVADLTYHGLTIRRLLGGDIIRLTLQSSAGMLWQWAFFRVALLGFLT
jgi:hypothetical protein